MQLNVFDSLVAVLRSLEKEGHVKPLRSITAERLVAFEPKVYERAGVTSWAQYANAAQGNGVVILGFDGICGTDWIQLDPQRKMVKSTQHGSILARGPGSQTGHLAESFRPLIGGDQELKTHSSDQPGTTSTDRIMDATESQNVVATRPNAALVVEWSNAPAEDADKGGSSRVNSDDGGGSSSSSGSGSVSVSDSDSGSNDSIGSRERRGSSSSRISDGTSSDKTVPGASPAGKLEPVRFFPLCVHTIRALFPTILMQKIQMFGTVQSTQQRSFRSSMCTTTSVIKDAIQTLTGFLKSYSSSSEWERSPMPKTLCSPSPGHGSLI